MAKEREYYKKEIEKLKNQSIKIIVTDDGKSTRTIQWDCKYKIMEPTLPTTTK